MVDYPLTQEQIEDLSGEERVEYLVKHQLAALDLKNFKANAIEKIKSFGDLLTPEQRAEFTSDKFLNAAYRNAEKEQKKNEERILNAAVRKLERTSVADIAPYTDKELSVGKKVAAGPDLVILDGGPGAGKSFGLGEAIKSNTALDKKREYVFCLGSTPTAAADLKKDLTKKDDNDNVVSEANGGYTIKEIMTPGTKAHDEWIKFIGKCKEDGVKPMIIVDEAGLLDDKETAFILENAPGKLILAGDSRQIPPEKGNQPFAMLVESTKDSPAYVNAPYVFRQGNFTEKLITSGIYKGLNNNDVAISKTEATEFLTTAYGLDKSGAVGIEFTDNKDRTFKQYLDSHPDLEAIKKCEGNTLVEQYVNYLNSKKEEFFPKSGISLPNGQDQGQEAALKNSMNMNPSQMTIADFDKYMCSALIAQHRGMQAYETKGQLESAKDDDALFKDVAKDFAEHYAKSRTEAFEKRKTKAGKKAKKDAEEKGCSEEEINAQIKSAVTKEENAGEDFSEGMLAITATVEEADKLNDAIREARGFKGKGVQEGEPILLKNGTKRLATKEDMEKGLPEGARYAYALDVKATQGLSQKGEVTMVVTQENADKWRGGESLVGASRHKGKFKIKMAEGVDKGKFYDASTKQFAAGRNINPPFSGHLAAAAQKIGKRAKDAAKKINDAVQSISQGTFRKSFKAFVQKKEYESLVARKNARTGMGLG
ncbi:MAG: AAA family ATPase [Alphaproteobacteria bacterium]|nr:AAA family ATPase [Alphaproteobacteria bacterium]